MYLSSGTLSENRVVNNLKSSQSRTQLIIVTDNCSNGFSALYVFKAFTVLKPTSKIVARNKNGDAIKLRLVVAKGWDLQSIQASIQQDSKDFPTQRLCKAEYYSNKYNTFLDIVTKLL